MTRTHQERLLHDLLPSDLSGSKAPPIPEAQAPSLEKLTIQVVEPRVPTETDLLNAVDAFVHTNSPRTARGVGEIIEAGDEVFVDMIAFERGRVVPLSALNEVWLSVENDHQLPGLREKLVGSKVGDSISVEVAFPADHFDPEWARRVLFYAVEVRGAEQIFDASLDDSSFLASVGVSSPEELFEIVFSMLEGERASEIGIRVGREVTAELERRLARVNIPEALLNEEIEVRWRQIEGVRLREWQLSSEEQAFARDAFVDDPKNRQEIHRSLRVTIALAALVKAHALVPTHSQFIEWLASAADANGTSIEEAKDVLRDDEVEQGRFAQSLMLEVAYQHVLSLADVELLSPPAS